MSMLPADAHRRLLRPSAIIHVSLKEQQVPKMGEAPPCVRSDCPGELGWEMGFGMAGGGYGAYHYCPVCEQVIDKDQEKFE